MTNQHTPCILIADDNPNNVKVLSSMLESKGYDTRVALNGEQALESIRQVPPDLILLDIHMPKMDGYEVCQAIKRDDALKDIGVIFISALTEQFNKIQGFRLGAVDYIEKPFHVEEVEARVETQLKLKYYQQQLKERVQVSENRLELAARAANIGIWEWQPDTDSLLWDDRMFGLYGIEKADFKHNISSWYDLLHGDDRNRVMDKMASCLSENKNFELEFRIKKPDRAVTHLSVKGGPGPARQDKIKSVVGVTLDITERIVAQENKRKMEDRLRQAQKMESIGTLAGGVAHDFNNILSGIFAYSQMAERQIEEPDKLRKNIRQIVNGAKRATELVHQILIFSRKQEYQKQPVRLDYIVTEVIRLLLPSIPSNIEVKEKLRSNEKVKADPTKMHQVIMNLCTNAMHAMADTGGVLTIKSKDIDITRTQSIELDGPDPGPYVKLEVRDTGKGIEKELMEKIFEPYFTTKKAGEGTGLGLAVVHGIIQDHNGVIKVYSHKQGGASFHVYLPVAGVEH